MMASGHFLNPHLCNSRGDDRKMWRNLNLFYYVSLKWPDNRGGNLELWPEGPKGERISLHSKFNRLVVMETHQKSSHSVSQTRTIAADAAFPITISRPRRCARTINSMSRRSGDGLNSRSVTQFYWRIRRPVPRCGRCSSAVWSTTSTSTSRFDSRPPTVRVGGSFAHPAAGSASTVRPANRVYVSAASGSVSSWPSMKRGYGGRF